MDLVSIPLFPLTNEVGVLLQGAAVLLVGLAGGHVAKRLHVPSVTGNILAGVLVGVLGLFGDADVPANLRPITNFAMGLIAMSVGASLAYSKIHNALQRIVSISALEAGTAIFAVTVATALLGIPLPVAFVLGCIAAETAPATTIALVNETRAKGTFVKTLLNTVALDNMLCIVGFTFAFTMLVDYYEHGDNGIPLGLGSVHTLWQLFGAGVLGIALGIVGDRLTHWPGIQDFSAIFLTVLLAVSLATWLGFSSLLTALFLGIYLGNASPHTQRQVDILRPITPLLFVAFFTLAGLKLKLGAIPAAGALFVAFVIARFGGKLLGAWVGGYIGQTSERIRSNIGLALMPQAGISIGLIVLFASDPRIPREVAELATTVVLAAVTANELIGPLFTRLALQRAREVCKDQRRLMEFLQEEYILVPLRAKDKWEAIRKLHDFYSRTHQVPQHERADLLATVEERERSMSTALGLGTAIPHGRVERGSSIQGVLGIAREPIDWEAPDGEPVRLVMLVVTPKGHEKEHLEVMATLSKMVSDDVIRTRLLAAIDANDAWEVIEGEETPNYNYYLDQPDDAPPNER